MKPIIIDMKDMSDSKEVYESKPNRFMIYTIYVILCILVVIVIWMCVFKIDIVVKSNGIFKENSNLYEISSAVTGRVNENYVSNGQYVTEGEILYELDIETLSDAIIRYQNEMKESKDRLEILSAYEKSLEAGKKELDICAENPYYNEFVNRRELLYANVTLNESDANGQVTVHQGNVDSISEAILEYEEKISQLNVVKQCVMERSNVIESSDSYYYSVVSSYLASYSYATIRYDNQINEYQRQIDECEDVKDEEEKNKLIELRDALQTEKKQELSKLELQQITAIEQQIFGYNDTILSLETNLASARLQLEAANGVDNETRENVAVLTEKGNIAAEILSCQEKVKECENYLKGYDIQNDNCIVKASTSGYYYVAKELKTGTYIREGVALGTIYPEQKSKYFAEIYVENSDIAKIKEGQEVKFEIAAYPSNEYGYFKGVVETIAKDITVDENTGYAYYLVKVGCDHMTVKNKKGEEALLINGMACQAKVVVDEERVLNHFLEKIDLLD